MTDPAVGGGGGSDGGRSVLVLTAESRRLVSGTSSSRSYNNINGHGH